MANHSPRRLALLLWLAAWIAFVVLATFPVNSFATRAGALGLFAVLWFGALGLWWRKKAVRWIIAGATGAVGVFFALPSRERPPVETLRADYTAALRRYEGAKYFWGGECAWGIDCSGLTRRAMVDALLLRGARRADPGLVRGALLLWWRDRSADFLGKANGEQTLPLFSALSINELDHARLQPGDMAVTADGRHILAYLGDREWIEADPGEGRVLIERAPVAGNVWFNGPVNLVRWRWLSP